jgi:hypothetical protein
VTVESPNTELSVRTESIQSLYTRYRAHRFNVNRRYQRKLVWSVEEKWSLIDSILLSMPIPLFLVAETGIGADASFEVIDGMQRLNAMFSFLENEFPVKGSYFDLDALADTKSLKDQHFLQQKHPILSRNASVAYSNYTVALSVYRSHDGAHVDEVFRRINSGGKTLSFQELRQAGTISPLADLVRTISSRIRGDSSPTDIVPLGKMPELSITNRDLPYGVTVEDIYWVRHGILRGDDVRTSDDEQLVLDILTDCIIHPFITGSRETRDSSYGFVSKHIEANPHEDLSAKIDNAIEKHGQERLEERFMDAYDVVRAIIDAQDEKFGKLIGIRRGGRAPRYFHCLFVAIFEMMFNDNMRLKDPKGAASRLVNSSTSVLKIPTGSAWSGDSKRDSIDSIKGVMAAYFERSSDIKDLAQFGHASHIEKLLANAKVEQQLFEMKQGFCRLDERRQFDQNALDKVCETLSAMANSGPETVGYLVVGVSDKPNDTRRIEALDKVHAVSYRHFDIVGIDREAALRGQRLAEYWDWLVQKLRENKNLDNRLSTQITRDAQIADYRGLTLAVFKVKSLSEPNFFGEDLFERSGSENRQVSKRDYARLYAAFNT